MFKGFAERRIARDADRIVALKEDLDALSWGRVLEIGRRLQELALGEEVGGLAQELAGIARSNISLEAKLGIEPNRTGSKTLASGVRVIEGGLAEVSAGADMPLDEPSFDDLEPFQDSFDEELRSFFEDPDQPAEAAVSTALVEEGKPAAEREELAVNADLDVSAQTAEREQSPTEKDSGAPEQEAPKGRFATFHNLYSSRDGGLCLYEDENGHLIAVDSSKLV